MSVLLRLSCPGPASKRLKQPLTLDLMQRRFKGMAFNLHRADPKTGRRDKVHVSGHSRAGRCSTGHETN